MMACFKLNEIRSLIKSGDLIKVNSDLDLGKLFRKVAEEVL
jgi:uncharacterized protein YihD (DUF1040 family)